MKFLSIRIALCLLLLSSLQSFSQSADSLGLPGDQLDLYAVMDAFEKTKDLESFEKTINEESSGINNFDLNADGEVDYIRVIDHNDGNVHAITLQIELSDNLIQDVAVFEIEKTGNESVSLQLVGDEDLYGSNYIIDPNADEDYTKSMARIIVNVWLWPSVRFIYAPGYVIYVSPFHYKRYPHWWKPWHPVQWHHYHNRCVVYHGRYHRTHVIRAHNAHRVYKTKRATVVKKKQLTTKSKSKATKTEPRTKKESSGQKNKSETKQKTQSKSQKSGGQRGRK
ncbi:MAG: hypothetical protein ACOYLH_07780 [Flavobacteriales bacterium]